MLALVLAGCGTTQTQKAIKIGVLADLSGDYAKDLRGIHRGVELAAADVNFTANIQLIIEDQKSCNAKETVTIMQKFVSVDRVNFIVGGTCSSTTLAAAPIANQARTVMISPSSSAPSITTAGEYVFRTYISDGLRGEQAGELACQLGKKRMALLTETTNPAPVELSAKTKQTFARCGTIVTEEALSTENDFRTQLTKIKEASPDVLIFSIGTGSKLAQALLQAQQLGISTQVISPLESAEYPELFQLAGTSAEGLIYIKPGTPPQTEAVQSLQKKYKQKYNEEVPDYVAEAYDAAMLGIQAVLSSKTAEQMPEKLTQISKSYNGVSGNVTFDENGDVHKPSQIMQVRNKAYVPYSP